MKSRIIKTPAALSRGQGGPESIPTTNSRSYFDEQGEEGLDIPAQARQSLNRILNDYSSFSVSTIESFFKASCEYF